MHISPTVRKFAEIFILLLLPSLGIGEETSHSKGGTTSPKVRPQNTSAVCSQSPFCPDGRTRFWAPIYIDADLLPKSEILRANKERKTKVAIFDTGLDKNLVGKKFERSGIEFVGRSDRDNNGHGTAVASIMIGKNGAGVLPGYPVTIYWGMEANLSAKLKHACNAGHRIINLSSGVQEENRMTRAGYAQARTIPLSDDLDLIRYLDDRGCLVFQSSGNQGRERAVSPPWLGSPVVTTESSEPNFAKASSFSRVGNLTAPGEEVFVWDSGQIEEPEIPVNQCGRKDGHLASGSSFAAPMSAILGAIVLQTLLEGEEFQKLTASNQARFVKLLLKASSFNGNINAIRAYEMAKFWKNQKELNRIIKTESTDRLWPEAQQRINFCKTPPVIGKCKEIPADSCDPIRTCLQDSRRYIALCEAAPKAIFDISKVALRQKHLDLSNHWLRLLSRPLCEGEACEYTNFLENYISNNKKTVLDPTLPVALYSQITLKSKHRSDVLNRWLKDEQIPAHSNLFPKQGRENPTKDEIKKGAKMLRFFENLGRAGFIDNDLLQKVLLENGQDIRLQRIILKNIAFTPKEIPGAVDTLHKYIKSYRKLPPENEYQKLRKKEAKIGFILSALNDVLTESYKERNARIRGEGIQRESPLHGVSPLLTGLLEIAMDKTESSITRISIINSLLDLTFGSQQLKGALTKEGERVLLEKLVEATKGIEWDRLRYRVFYVLWNQNSKVSQHERERHIIDLLNDPVEREDMFETSVSFGLEKGPAITSKKNLADLLDAWKKSPLTKEIPMSRIRAAVELAVKEKVISQADTDQLWKELSEKDK